MRRLDFLEGTVTTILAFFLVGPTPSLWNIVDSSFVFGIIRHLIEDTTIQFNSFVRMKNIIVVGYDALEGHATIKQPEYVTPTPTFSKVALADNVNKLIVHIHVRAQYEETTLHWFVLSCGAHHVV